MTARVRKIDELTEGDHAFIDKDSNCYYFFEYPSGNDSVNKQNPVFSYIHNFKKKPDRKGLPEWKYKIQAIERTIILFHEHFKRTRSISDYTLVPIPPSKIRTDPMYDDRMEQVLNGLSFMNHGCDYRNLIICRQNITASHETNDRPSIEQIQNNYFIDQDLLPGASNIIVLIDDVLTTGAHFCAAKRFLLNYFPYATFVGLFIARRILPDPDPFDDFDLSSLF